MCIFFKYVIQECCQLLNLCSIGDRWINVYEALLADTDQGKPNYPEKTCHSATFSTPNPMWIGLVLNPGLLGERPATAWNVILSPPWYYTSEDTWLFFLSLLMYVMSCSTWGVNRSERCHCVWWPVENLVLIVGYNQEALYNVTPFSSTGTNSQ